MGNPADEFIRYYEKELGWVPPFVRIFARYTEPPQGALPKKTKEMLFSILDCVTGEANGARAHAKSAIDAGLKVEELAEGFVIAVMVTGITTMCKGGVAAIEAAEERLKERHGVRSE
jgi:alkylhydroperoxidase/carboxymuconolactone decarboxylase family protein YurZ